MSFKILQGPRFLAAMKRLSGDRQLLTDVQKGVDFLGSGTVTPGMRLKRVGSDPTRPLYEVRLNDGDRLLYEGPFQQSSDGEPALYVHEVGRHDDISAMIERALGRPPSKSDLEESEVFSHGPEVPEPQIVSEQPCYCIPWPAYLDAEKFDILIQNVTASLRLTREQQVSCGLFMESKICPRGHASCLMASCCAN